jgi:hypothetical protein
VLMLLCRRGLVDPEARGLCPFDFNVSSQRYPNNGESFTESFRTNFRLETGKRPAISPSLGRKQGGRR